MTFSQAPFQAITSRMRDVIGAVPVALLARLPMAQSLQQGVEGWSTPARQVFVMGRIGARICSAPCSLIHYARPCEARERRASESMSREGEDGAGDHETRRGGEVDQGQARWKWPG